MSEGRGAPRRRVPSRRRAPGRRSVRRGRGPSPARLARLSPLLEAFDGAYDRARRIGFDPVEVPRRFRSADDQEVAGLFAAALAYGRADLFKPRLEAVVQGMGASPAQYCEEFARDPEPDPEAFRGFQYRFNQPEDLAALAAAIGAVRLRNGTLGARFAALLAEEERARSPLRAALIRFAGELRDAPSARAILARRGVRGLRHLLPDPAGAGACKRWNLYLRWMVRGPDAVDLGAWKGVSPSQLVVPLDTHVARIARYLGLTDRRDLTWRTAEEITDALRRIDPADPVRFDFALCHLGMSGACPPRRDRACCAACPVSAACRVRA